MQEERHGVAFSTFFDSSATPIELIKATVDGMAARADEIGQLQTTLRRMRETLAQTIGSIREQIATTGSTAAPADRATQNVCYWCNSSLLAQQVS